MASTQLAPRDRRVTTIEAPVAPIVDRSRWTLAIVLVAALATRLPFVLASPGAGRDVDSARLVLAGRALSATGRYHLSRNPGYPLVELVSAALSGLPVTVLVALTAVVGAVGVTAFADLLRTLGIRAWVPVTAAYAVTPLVWLSDLTFMDYSWAQTATVVSLALLARARFLACGAMLGVAAACRPAALVAVVVVGAVLVLDRRDRWTWARVVGPLTLVVAASQLLPLLTLGPLYLRFVDQPVGWTVALGKLSTGVWGWAGTIAIAAGLAVAAVTVRDRWVAVPPRQRTWAWAALLGAVAVVALFLRLPVDSGYLLPAVPLVLLLLGVILSGRALATIAGALLLGALFAPGPKALGVSVPEATAARQAEDARLQSLASTARGLPPGGVLAVRRSDLPALLVFLPEASSRGLEYDLGWNPVPERAVLPGGGSVVAGGR